MHTTERIANVVAGGAIASGAVFGTIDALDLSSNRAAYADLLEDRTGAIQDYREEYPETTTVPIAIEDEYAPKIAAAATEADKARDAIMPDVIVLGSGSALMLGTLGIGAMRLRRERETQHANDYDNLVDDYNDLANTYDGLLKHYDNQRTTEERLLAMTIVLDMRIEDLSENGVSPDVITGIVDRVLAQIDDRFRDEPLHSNSHNEWGPDTDDVDPPTVPSFEPVSTPLPARTDAEPGFVVEPNQQPEFIIEQPATTPASQTTEGTALIQPRRTTQNSSLTPRQLKKANRRRRQQAGL